MANEKGFEVGAEKTEDFQSDTANRARNRTVMLTPDITGQVRAMLAQEMGGQPSPAAAPQGGAGFFGMQANPASTYAPAGEASGRSAAVDAPKRLPASSGPVAVTAAPPPPVAAHSGRIATSAANSPVVGFMVCFDENPNGEVVELRQGRWIVSCEQPPSSTNFILIQDVTVSPLHAIVRVSASGEIQVLDQLSEHGTGVKKFGQSDEEVLTGAMSSLEHGDVVRFGKRSFHVCIIQRS